MTYRKDIDALKGLAILAVVLYHMGLLKSGYLGVDAFFVINGFLVVPSIIRRIEADEFSFFKFIEQRIFRLLPLVVVASIVCLAIGALGMLPDDYENLAESVVASNLFSENILSAITTKDYWNAINDYKPLMHLWYVGILFEFYVTFPLIILLTRFVKKKIIKTQDSSSLFTITVLLAISIVLYCLPFAPESSKFYFVQYRYFEILLGGVVGLTSLPEKKASKISTVPFFLWIFVVFSGIITFDVNSIGTNLPVIGTAVRETNNALITDKSSLLLLTTVISGVVLSRNNSNSRGLSNSVLAEIGKRSYSIFIWHQILLAFYRYFYSKEITVLFVICYLIAVAVLSEISYRFIEKRLKLSRKTFGFLIATTIITTVFASIIYLRAGVIRDVPEQNIVANDVTRNMHAKYVDRVYRYDKEFPENNHKINVIVEGVSFGRDFANILLESDYADKINLSYIFKWDISDIYRIKNADYIFTFSSKLEVPQYVWNNKKIAADVYGIGTKNYGESNGSIYRKRNRENYFESTIVPDEGYVRLNEQWRDEWGKYYIDFIQMASTEDGMIRVFTPEGKFISQDCSHLTEEGAKWYAKIIDWDSIFSNKQY